MEVECMECVDVRQSCAPHAPYKRSADLGPIYCDCSRVSL